MKKFLEIIFFDMIFIKIFHCETLFNEKIKKKLQTICMHIYRNLFTNKLNLNTLFLFTFFF